MPPKPSFFYDEQELDALPKQSVNNWKTKEEQPLCYNPLYRGRSDLDASDSKLEEPATDRDDPVLTRRDCIGMEWVCR